jgi:biopolymer transport protein ExbD
MSWNLRHEGSPAVIEGLTTEQVAQGLGEGSWEPTDEIRGPDDPAWLALENHPQFAELAAELEPPVARGEPDETHLDMNPLIDVCLVLLIFFMLTASYAALQKFIESPNLNPKSINDVPTIKADKINEIAIPVTAKREGDKTVIRVEKEVVELADLSATLKKGLKANAKKTSMWLDLDDKVPYGTYIAIIDQAADAGIPVLLQVPAKEGLAPKGKQ